MTHAPTRPALAALFVGLMAVQAHAEILDTDGMVAAFASNDPHMVVLDDSGRIWSLATSCGSEWTLLDTIPGAIAFDWDRSIGVVTPVNGDLLLGQVFSTSGPFVVARTIPLPASDVVDVALGPDNSGSRVWIRTASGSFWHLWVTPTGHQWDGPCSGPAGPVALDQDSWGSTKGRFR